jgi:hypothetical protein
MGRGFEENDQVPIWVNGHLIGTVPVSSGSFTCLLDTTGAAEGLYIILTPAQPPIPMEFFVLDENELVRETKDNGPVFVVPPDSAFTSRLFLPTLYKSEPR